MPIVQQVVTAPGWADDLLAETAPPLAASFGALREWSWHVVLASLEGQSYEIIEAIGAALSCRLRSYGLAKAEADLLMDLPMPPIGRPAERSGTRARLCIAAPRLVRRLPDPRRAGRAGRAVEQ